MLNYIIRRSIYSVLIIFGVIILTFILFRFAAGDPAATLLGKNPSPAEVEKLRMDLASDKPLFWGHWRKTEAFSTVDFAERLEAPGLLIEGENNYEKGFIRLNNGRLLFKRNFDLGDTKLKADISFRGSFSCLGMNFISEKKRRKVSIELPGNSADFALEKSDFAKFADFERIEFFRRQDSAFDSQIMETMKEIVSFKPQFPFVKFFNFGKTLITKESIMDVIRRGVGPSLMLMIPIFFGEMLLGTVLALISTAFRGHWPDRLIVMLSVAGMSISYLVFIIFGQWYLGYYFNWFPVWGYNNWRYFVLPVLIGILSGLGEGVRFYRTIFVNELRKEYLRTAEAKGCHPFSIYCRHLLGNAAIPIITRASSILPFLFTGSLLLESFFGIPGLGYAGINALMNSDLQMIKALVILTAFIFVAINLLTDIAYAWADPRIRVE